MCSGRMSSRPQGMPPSGLNDGISLYLIIFHNNFSTQIMKGSIPLFLCILFSLSTSNIWDNMFSSMRARTPIILKTSLNFGFPFKYNGVELQGQFDYNVDHEVVNIFLSKQLWIVTIPVLQIQVDLRSTFITIKDPKKCQKKKLQIFEDKEEEEQYQEIMENPFSKIFLLNVLFKYVGQEKGLKKFVFEPDLLAPHERSHNEYEQNFLLEVDDNGRIRRIYDKDGRGRKRLEFSLKSKVKKKLRCSGKVDIITREDLQKIIEDFINDQD